MDVLAAAASIGLMGTAGDDVLGTIEEETVLDTLSQVSAAYPDCDDLFSEAIARVQLARSAGVEKIESDSVFAVRRSGLTIQLRYRSEMRDMFSDLAIDVALRTRKPATV